MTTVTEQIVVAALYKFTPLDDLEAIQNLLLAAARCASVRGTLLIAPEGINGTVAGSRAGIDALLTAIRALPGCADLKHKESHADSPPFGRMKVRIKREIVTMGVPDLDPSANAGAYIEPADWNALISDPDVVLIDARNDYEYDIGSFAGAINPETASFGELPDWLRRNLKANPETKVAMFCTGGIRCEKSTAYLKSLGFREVYHLKGGILKYLEEIPTAESLWQGACFVFDERVSVGHGLAIGPHRLCRTCGWAIEHDQACPRCVGEDPPGARPQPQS